MNASFRGFAFENVEKQKANENKNSLNAKQATI
jgi:hypothetical protein